MKHPVGECGHGAENPTDVPEQVGVEVVEDEAREHGREGGGQQPCQPEDGHIPSAHFFGGEVGGDGLAGGHDENFSDGDDQIGRAHV